MKIRVEHDCGADDAQERLTSLARDHGIAVESADGGASGSLAHHTPLGEVRASYRVLEDAVEVVVGKKPAFLPEGLVRRKVEEELRDILAGRP